MRLAVMCSVFCLRIPAQHIWALFCCKNQATKAFFSDRRFWKMSQRLNSELLNTDKWVVTYSKLLAYSVLERMFKLCSVSIMMTRGASLLPDLCPPTVGWAKQVQAEMHLVKLFHSPKTIGKWGPGKKNKNKQIIYKKKYVQPVIAQLLYLTFSLFMDVISWDRWSRLIRAFLVTPFPM